MLGQIQYGLWRLTNSDFIKSKFNEDASYIYLNSHDANFIPDSNAPVPELGPDYFGDGLDGSDKGLFGSMFDSLSDWFNDWRTAEDREWEEFFQDFKENHSSRRGDFSQSHSQSFSDYNPDVELDDIHFSSLDNERDIF